MTTPTNPNLQSPSGRSNHPPSPRARKLIEHNLISGPKATTPSMAQRIRDDDKVGPEASSPSMAQAIQDDDEEIEFSPIIGVCGCAFKPCQKCDFDKDIFHKIHRMLGIDPSPDETDKKVRSEAQIPRLLGNKYPNLSNRLEAVIRRGIQKDVTFSKAERDHCYRRLGMDDGAIAERNKHRERPTGGTPEGYRMDGGPGAASDRWLGPRNPGTGKYVEQAWQRDMENRMLPRTQATTASTSSSQWPRISTQAIPAPLSSHQRSRTIFYDPNDDRDNFLGRRDIVEQIQESIETNIKPTSRQE